jgi:hypothetical protein
MHKPKVKALVGKSKNVPAVSYPKGKSKPNTPQSRRRKAASVYGKWASGDV